jgi:hypothetical protein
MVGVLLLDFTAFLRLVSTAKACCVGICCYIDYK